MRHTLRIAWAIARRDYVAAVFSRLFVLFLLLPLTLAAITALFGAIGAHGDDSGPPPVPHVRIVADAAGTAALTAARADIVRRIGGDVVPALATGEHEASVGTLSGGLAHPRLLLDADAPPGLAGQVELIVDQARAARGPALVVETARRPAAAAPPHRDDGRNALARAGQYVILVLTMMLAGRLLSSFIEERGNKVIEILAGAVPIDAIFLGKLVGMLFFALTCAAAWGAAAVVGTLALAPQMLADAVAPGVGWPAYVLLAVIYFSMSYMLLGAVMLGLGSQANSPADVQTLALPTTIGQLMLFALASIHVAQPDHPIALFAAILPWSSPLAMIARAAEREALWPHLIAVVWQAGWLAVTVRLAAARFRRGVLKSGPVRREKGRGAAAVNLPLAKPD